MQFFKHARILGGQSFIDSGGRHPSTVIVISQNEGDLLGRWLARW
jgi:hypothetical protein